MPTVKKHMLSASSVKARPGWTDSAIVKFLGEPDERKTNPTYRMAPPMRLYRLNRVEAVEATPEFATHAQKSTLRSVSALAVAERKRRETLAWANTVPITLGSVRSLDAVQQSSIRHFNERQKWKSAVWGDSRDNAPSLLKEMSNVEESFLDRITVNYLRHEMSNYEGLLEEKFGRIGNAEAYGVIKRRVLEVIADTYPILSDAVARQLIDLSVWLYEAGQVTAAKAKTGRGKRAEQGTGDVSWPR